MEIRRAHVIAVAAVAAFVLHVAAATTYTVGVPDGLWDMMTNYDEWVAARRFHPGDKLTFTYSPQLHDVVEVRKEGYDACSNLNNISAFRSGNDVVVLNAVGTRYFLCGLTGHCDSGMKIRIDVVAADAGPAASPVPTSTGFVTATAGKVGFAAVATALVQALMVMW